MAGMEIRGKWCLTSKSLCVFWVHSSPQWSCHHVLELHHFARITCCDQTPCGGTVIEWKWYNHLKMPFGHVSKHNTLRTQHYKNTELQACFIYSLIVFIILSCLPIELQMVMRNTFWYWYLFLTTQQLWHYWGNPAWGAETQLSASCHQAAPVSWCLLV